jgi:hypothetical protein
MLVCDGRIPSEELGSDETDHVGAIEMIGDEPYLSEAESSGSEPRQDPVVQR